MEGRPSHPGPDRIVQGGLRHLRSSSLIWFPTHSRSIPRHAEDKCFGVKRSRTQKVEKRGREEPPMTESCLLSRARATPHKCTLFGNPIGARRLPLSPLAALFLAFQGAVVIVSGVANNDSGGSGGGSGNDTNSTTLSTNVNPGDQSADGPYTGVNYILVVVGVVLIGLALCFGGFCYCCPHRCPFLFGKRGRAAGGDRGRGEYSRQRGFSDAMGEIELDLHGDDGTLMVSFCSLSLSHSLSLLWLSLFSLSLPLSNSCHYH